MANGWTARERAFVKGLSTPWEIQRFLDSIPYSTEPRYRSPRSVVRERAAHCVDGALFAAAALRRLGHRPLVTWIWAENDDGHLFALFREGGPGANGQMAKRRMSKGKRKTGRAGGCWGAVAKSNVVNLRYRPPVYRSLRELMMSCFNDYFNTIGERTMRSYTRPLDLSKFDAMGWETEDDALPRIIDEEIDRLAVVPVVTGAQVKRLEKIDQRALRAGLLGADEKGLFRPRGEGMK